MKKTIYILCMVFFLAYFSCLHAFAYDSTYNSQLDIIGAKEIESSLSSEVSKNVAYEFLQSFSISESLIQTLDNTLEGNEYIISNAIKSLSKVLVVIMFCSCAQGMQSPLNMQKTTIDMAGALSISALIMSDLGGMMSLVTNTFDQIDIFSKAMLPVMAGALTISGSPTTATVISATTMIAFNLLMRFVSYVLVPAVYAYIAIITVNAAIGSDPLGKLADFIKWITTSSLKLLLTIFIAYVTLSGSISSGIDKVALKTARFAVSGTIPVVGSIISDATETIISGAVLVKNSVGFFGMLCVIAICLVPFLSVGINYLVFKAGAAVLSPICSKNLVSLISGISSSFGMLLGMIATCCAIIFFELVFTVSMVSAT